MYRHMFNWNIVACGVKQPISLSLLNWAVVVACFSILQIIAREETKEYLTQFYDKTHYTNRKFKNQRTTHKRHQKPTYDGQLE